MKRRTHRAGKSAERIAVAIELESLELRCLLSTTGYQLAATVTDTQGGGAYQTFGSNIVTQGNLALISSLGESTEITLDGGQTYEPVDTSSGKVTLYDTSTQQIVQTFNNPEGNVSNAGFGEGLAFVGNKIAISAPGENAVYIYDGYADSTPDQTITFTGTPNPFSDFGARIAAYGNNDLLITQMQDTPNNNGVIFNYDLTTGSNTPVGTYTDPDPNAPATANHFGEFLATDGTTIFARSIDASRSFYNVVAIDSGGNLLHTYNGNSGGSSLAPLAASNGSVFIGDSNPLEIEQYDAAGNLLHTFVPPSSDPYISAESWGAPVVVNGNHLAVGNPTQFQTFLDDPNDPNSLDGTPNGAIYIYDLNDPNAVASPINEIDNPTPTLGEGNSDLADQDENFGLAIGALPNDNFLIGNPYDNNANGIDAGTVYQYQPIPTTPVNQPPVADAGAAQTTTENATVILDASGSTDPDGQADIVSYSWDLNNDGVFGDATGVTTPFTEDLPGTYPVAVQVTDSAGNVSTASTTVTFTDVHPTADAGADQSALTTDTVNFNGSGNNASGDAIVGYAWDFNYDGNPADFVSQASGASTSHNFATAGTYTVALQVTDDDGDTAIDTTTVTITNPPPVNHAPVAGPITGPSSAVRQQTVTFNGSFTDADAGDMHTVSWDFGDGNTIATHPTTDANALSVSHAYLSSGTYTVSMTITDSANASSTATFNINVTATGVQGGTMFVGGTTGNDNVSVTKNGGSYNVTIGGVTSAYTGNNIVIFAGSGNDVILVANNVTATVEAHGGDGNDIITGGGGSSILVGDAGNDILVGGAGQDLLIGGTGSDVITGDAGQDILIAGYTSHDNDSAALNSILATWNGAGTYAARVGALKSGLLNPSTSVFDDGQIDILYGGGGTDWYMYNFDSTGTVKDIVLDQRPSETGTDIDPA